MRYEILSKSDCSKLHEASLDVLERTGAQILVKDIRDLLKENGCSVDESTMTVRFPRSLVNDCLGKCPSEFTITGRDRKKAKKMAYDGKSHYSNFGTAVKFGTYDENGKYYTTKATDKHVGEAIKYVDALPNFSMGVTPMSAVNLVGTGVAKDVHEQYEVLVNMTKHTMADWVSVNLHYGFEFEKALCGGDEEEALKNPLYTIGAPSASPLTFDDRFASNVVEATKYHMPVMAMGMVLNGATGPVFLAGSLAVAIAESLATIVVAQCLNPGNAVWFGSSGTILDLKSGAPAVGSPERAMISAAYANMGYYYKLPTFIAGSETDSKIIDVQDGHEKTLTGILGTLANASMHFGPGMLENGLTFSPEQLMIDNDIISMMDYVSNGIEITDETLSLDDIDKVGPGGDFLSLPATLSNINNQSSPEFFDRLDYQAWLDGKHGKDAAFAAREKALDIKNNYEVDPIDKDVLKILQEIVKRADKEIGQ